MEPINKILFTFFWGKEEMIFMLILL